MDPLLLSWLVAVAVAVAPRLSIEAGAEADADGAANSGQSPPRIGSSICPRRFAASDPISAASTLIPAFPLPANSSADIDAPPITEEETAAPAEEEVTPTPLVKGWGSASLFLMAPAVPQAPPSRRLCVTETLLEAAAVAHEFSVGLSGDGAVTAIEEAELAPAAFGGELREIAA